MRSIQLLSIAFALSLGAAACDGGEGTSGGSTTAPAKGTEGSAAAPRGEVLASVNGIDITTDEFEEAAARKTPAEGDSLSVAEKQEILDKLVAEKLLYKHALEKGLDKDPKVQKVMVNTLLREDVYANVRNSDFTDEELSKYYETNKDEFIVPEKVQIKRILIKVSDERSDADAKAEATRIYGELKKDPGQFKDLASKSSEDPYRRRGGDVGFVAETGKPGLEPEVVTKAFSMKVDEISEPFRSAEGYNVITVANRRERVERTYQQMKGTVLRKVKNDKLKDLYESYVASLRNGSDVKINQDKLASLEVKASKRPVGPGFQLNPMEPGEEPEEGIEGDERDEE